MNGENTDRPIRLGIAGLGLAGAMMIRAAVVHPRIVLAAGVDPLPRPRETFARDFGARTHVDFRELCEEYWACSQVLERLERPNAEESLRTEYGALRLRLEGELLRYISEQSTRAGTPHT